ncbi:hypothetical protein [Acetobacter malorum]|uniref:hypothetical protein n=1 Tax=Acetobacter malorum TaxID=178901 RepID=UPI00248DE8BC|nr:hypothetical protein [Acetobacter malorum]
MNAKQILVAGCAFFCGAGVVSAASYQPFAPQGGLAITTLLPGVYADGTDGTPEQVARMADSSVQQADANQPNGYVKPDGTGAVTLPVKGSVAAATANAAGDTVSTIADTAKSAQATAGTAVQANGGDASKTKVVPTGSSASKALEDVAAQAVGSVQQQDANKPQGYVQPDASGNVTLPVIGSTSNAPATADGTATPRTLASRFSDTHNLADYGAALDGSGSDLSKIQTIYNALSDGAVVHVPVWSKWNGTISTPDLNKHITWIMDGALPGDYTPPPGDGDLSIYNGGASYHLERKDTYTKGFRFPAYFTYWNDNSGYQGAPGNWMQYAAVSISSISGPSSTGNTSPISITHDSYGQNPSTSYDVGINLNVNKYGQNSVWGIVDNIGDVSGKSPGFAASWNEFDLRANGYDIKPWDKSYGSPQAGHRSVFYVAGSHQNPSGWQSNWTMTAFSYAKGSTTKPQLVDVLGVDGVHYVWYVVKSGVSGSTNPGFPVPSKFNATISGTTMTVSGIYSGTINVGDYVTGAHPVTPIQITGQTSGTTGGVGVYTLASGTNSDQDEALEAAAHVTDGTGVWEYGEELNQSISSLVFFTGNPGDAVDTLVGAKEGITLGNAGVDTSLMTFQKNSAVVRGADGQPIDLSGNGTLAGANLHTLDHDNGALRYKVGGVTKFNVTDDGIVHAPNGLTIGADTGKVIGDGHDLVAAANLDGSQGPHLELRWQSPQVYLFVDGSNFGPVRVSIPMTKAAILAIPNAVEGLTRYDTDDHAEVQYRCPTGAANSCAWFQIEYGTALSK